MLHQICQNQGKKWIKMHESEKIKILTGIFKSEQNHSLEEIVSAIDECYNNKKGKKITFKKMAAKLKSIETDVKLLGKFEAVRRGLKEADIDVNDSQIDWSKEINKVIDAEPSKTGSSRRSSRKSSRRLRKSRRSSRKSR